MPEPSKPTPPFDAEALLEAFAEAARAGVGEPDGGYMTVRELSTLTGHCMDWVREQLRGLNHAGRLEWRQKRIDRIGGRFTAVPAYRLKP